MATWKCPYCRQRAEVGLGCLQYTRELDFGNYRALLELTVCRNPDCKRHALVVKLHELKRVDLPGGRSGVTTGKLINSWNLIPESRAIAWPAYVPDVVRKDYIEACKTEAPSAKASAALSRRCLQAIIREFYDISKARLIDEIDALEGRVDGPVLEALHALREIGNIGAHPERDPTIIVEIEPGEASKMIDLIEVLIRETYIARHEREAILQHVKEIAKQKQSEKSGH